MLFEGIEVLFENALTVESKEFVLFLYFCLIRLPAATTKAMQFQFRLYAHFCISICVFNITDFILRHFYVIYVEMTAFLINGFDMYMHRLFFY